MSDALYKRVYIVRVFVKEHEDDWAVFGNSGTRAPENSAVGWWTTEDEYLLSVHTHYEDAVERRNRYHDRIHRNEKLTPFVRTVPSDLSDYLLP